MGIFSKVVLILFVLLLIPTSLIIISQDAVPGDRTYPIKRDLEGVIAGVVSLNPQTKAFFNVGLADRRYKEAVALIKKGDNSGSSLAELVTQTQVAAKDINQVSGAETKKQLAASLTKQIDEYDRGLAGVEQTQQVQILPTATPIPSKIVPTIAATVNEAGSTSKISFTPTIIPTPTPFPTPVVSAPIQQQPSQQTPPTDIETTREQLRKIKEDLLRGEEDGDNKKVNSEQERKANSDKKEKENNKD